MYREILHEWLNELGFAVIALESGIGASKCIKNEHPIACFIDLFMDNKEGLETIIELRKIPNKPLLIAMSSSTEQLPVAKLLGADETLAKPLILTSIAALFRNLGILR